MDCNQIGLWFNDELEGEGIENYLSVMEKGRKCVNTFEWHAACHSV